MNKRLVWLAPIALLVLLSGCRVTFTTPGPLAPHSLVGYKLELINAERGGPLDPEVTAFPVEVQVTYYFLATDEARDFDLGSHVKTSQWSYKSSRNTGIVEVTFVRNLSTKFIVNCMLTFKDRLSGTHRCEFEDKEADSIEQNTIRFGWGAGAFELEKL